MKKEPSDDKELFQYVKGDDLTRFTNGPITVLPPAQDEDPLIKAYHNWKARRNTK